MKFRIKHRLFLAMLLAASLAVISLLAITQWNLSRGLLRFVNESEQAGIQKLATALEQFYADEQSWQPLQDQPEHWKQLILQAFLPEPQEWQPPFSSPPPHENNSRPRGLPPHLLDDFTSRLFLLNARQQPLTNFSAQTEKSKLILLHQGDRLIGYLGFIPLTHLVDDLHQNFLKEQKTTFLQVSGIIVLLAAILSFLLARRLVRPLEKLAEGTRKLISGEYSSRVPVEGDDEIGSLATDFNLLALTLEKNEQARRQWVADISHELRTPIGILRGETEALLDGIHKTDTAALLSLHAESLQLGRLVDDLYQLSMSDLGALSYRKKELNLAELLGELVDSSRSKFEQQSLQLSMTGANTNDYMLFGDPERLRQLFTNLLDNSLKYTDAGGHLTIELLKNSKNLQVNLCDTAPAVDESELGKLFDRLYRIESSRNRATGGAGLGLAICRNIVEAHQGTISAHHAPAGGLWIKIIFPLSGSH